MVNRRAPKAPMPAPAKKRRAPTNAEVEAFASEANGGKENPSTDTNAPRTFKALRVTFNAYEYQLLEEIAKKTGRTKLSAIRWAIVQFAKKEE